MGVRNETKWAPGAVAMLLAASWLGAFAEPTHAASRVALVIGNSAYEHTTPLRNPRNDANDMARALADLGFEVIDGLDLDKNGFAEKLREFARAARRADVSLFFYAGHGLQVDGDNYLVPIDARLKEEVDLRLEAFELAAFMSQMRSRTNLVFLDACRDNPLADGLKRSMGVTRSAAIQRGLGRVTDASGTLIAYATQPGNVADDGDGRNSPFTGALLAHMATPGLSVNDLLATVTDTVMTATHDDQQPWTHSSLRKPFYFIPAAYAAPRPVATAPQTVAIPQTAAAQVAATPRADESLVAPTLPHDGAFRDCPQCPRMVVIPAGAYEMGSPSGAGARDEERRHRVTIPQPLAVGMFEVQRREFTRFMEETNRSGGGACWQYDGVATKAGSAPMDPGFIQGENEPMVCVSWTDAKAYVDWLSRKTRKKYRLLSESEWEYAARGRTVTPRYWDNGESGQCGNANGADDALKSLYTDWFDLIAACDDGAVHTSEAGRYGPNEFGLYDMLGNAREWVEDCWHRDYGDAPADGSAWIDGGNCALRVLRGGSWLDGPGGVRSSTRDRGTTGIRFSANGFRVARALD